MRLLLFDCRAIGDRESEREILLINTAHTTVKPRPTQSILLLWHETQLKLSVQIEMK